ncbi:Dyp-type peroxidase [Pseudomonas aeruginosa]|uniref:Dyp-type peroxidase n=1 Tax=Pseudomonas aeruginosa TaxID=287 RepID=UPI003CF74F41
MIDGGNMSAAQPGILTPIPVVGRYLFFSISQPEQVAATLASLAAATDGYQLVVGIGHSLMLSLGKTVEGMKDYPVLAAPGIDLPSTPSALWCWLRGEDRGEMTLRSHALERSLAPAFQRTGAVDAFLYGEDRDLSGYKDGTENPKGDAALEAALVSGRGAGLDGGSFVAVQQWLHDFDRMQAIPGEEMDNIIGRRKSDDEELEDAPAYAHVKRTEQESFEPAAFLLRRGAPWSDEHRAGLLFAAFGRSFEAFELQWLRMIGVEDGVLDGLFRFTRPISGSYFWCPPMADGRLDLSALGL